MNNLRAACGEANKDNKTQSVPKVAKKASQSKKKEKTEEIPGTIHLKMKINTNCLMPSVRAFMIYNALSGLGDVVSSDPPNDNLDDIQAGQEINIVFKPTEDPAKVIDAMKRLSEVEYIEDSSQGSVANVESKNESKQSDNSIKSKNEAPHPADKVSTQNTKAIQTVRVGVDRLDTLMNLVAELVIDRTRINQIESDLSAKYEGEDIVNSLGETAVHIGRVVTELQEHIMKVRLLPVEQVFNRFPRMVRDLSRKAGKNIDFIIEGQETELDRSILEEIVDPITHLLRNSVDHGIESAEERAASGKPEKARVVLAAKQEENRIVIEVQDDGKGIDIEKVKAAALKNGAVSKETLVRMSDEDALQLIFASGVSTAEKITEISGRGVGMDVVRNNIQSLSGSVSVQTEPGIGTTFKLTLPLTLAIIQALVTGVDNRIFVIPLSAVVETFRCDTSEIRYIDSHPAINFRGSVLPLVTLGDVFESSRQIDKKQIDSITFVVVNTGGIKVGFVVDRLIGEQEVVIKPLGAFFGDLQGIAGATILGDGRVALIVDVAGLGGLLNRRRYDRKRNEVVEV